MAKTIGQLTSATTIGNSDLFVIEQSSQTFKIAASVVRGGLVDADIDAAAAIAYSKLDLDDSIVAGDLTADAVTTAKILDANVTTAKVADAAITPAKLSQPFTLATSQASTSGTSIDFTGIPSWAKRITVMFNGVSTNAASTYRIRVGVSGSFVATGYVCGSFAVTSAVAESVGNSSVGFDFSSVSSGSVQQGALVLEQCDSASWIGQGKFYDNNPTVRMAMVAGRVSGLAGAVDSITVTTAGGNTFDGGSINISYEG